MNCQNKWLEMKTVPQIKVYRQIVSLELNSFAKSDFEKFT